MARRVVWLYLVVGTVLVSHTASVLIQCQSKRSRTRYCSEGELCNGVERATFVSFEDSHLMMN